MATTDVDSPPDDGREAAVEGADVDTTELEVQDGEEVRIVGLPPWAGRLVLAIAALGLGTYVWVGLDINLLRVAVNGIQPGAVYALVALGIALVYKSTRVLNFAQGELGTAPAFFVFVALAGWDVGADRLDDVSKLEMLGWAGVAVLLGVILAVAINTLVVQRLADKSNVIALVATVGVALLFSSTELIIFEAQRRTFPRFVDGIPCLASDGGECTQFLALAGARIPWNALIVMGVLAVAAALLAAFFRTPPGIALLATSQEPYAAELHGVSTRAMSNIAWGAAGALGAIAGILGAGVFEGITPGLITTTFLIPAFTGAVLGGLNSMVGAVAGGLILGVSVALGNAIWTQFELSSTIPGPPQVVTFGLLLLVLLVRPRGLFGKEA